MTILDALGDANLFAQLFRPAESCAAWRAAVAAIHGLSMTAEQFATFQRHTATSDSAAFLFLRRGRPRRDA